MLKHGSAEQSIKLLEELRKYVSIIKILGFKKVKIVRKSYYHVKKAICTESNFLSLKKIVCIRIRLHIT